MTYSDNTPIRPEAVATKLAAIANFEFPEVREQMEANPRCSEILWFLQHVSQSANYAGGLRKFAADFLVDSRAMIGTASMREMGKRRIGFEEARKLMAEIPKPGRRKLGECCEGLHMADLLADIEAPDEASSVERWVHVLRYEKETSRAEKRAARREAEDFLKSVTWDAFEAACNKEADEHLVAHLRSMCHDPHIGFDAIKGNVGKSVGAPWYFCDLIPALLRFIDRRKELSRARIADTEITSVIYRWLEKVQRTGRSVLISGNSRFGKTEAVLTWARINAGAARLVNTPASTSEGELLREVAKALGMDYGASESTGRLRDRINYVLQHSRLMLIFDEAQFLLPMSFSRNTPPARLNWVRRSLMDNGIPCAFCCTPQGYNGAKKRYVKATGYAIEQFDERLLKTIMLPDQISKADLLAIARIHFPDLRAQYLEYVVTKAAATERNYVSDIEKIAALARDNAQEAGRKLPTLDDIKAAMADVLPPAERGGMPVSEPSRGRPREVVTKPLQRDSNEVANIGSESRNRINFDSVEETALAGLTG